MNNLADNCLPRRTTYKVKIKCNLLGLKLKLAKQKLSKHLLIYASSYNYSTTIFILQRCALWYNTKIRCSNFSYEYIMYSIHSNACCLLPDAWLYAPRYNDVSGKAQSKIGWTFGLDEIALVMPNFAVSP